MALDGKTGKTIWKTWTDHKVFAITCQADLNGDSVVDCVVGGMSGVRRLLFYINDILNNIIQNECLIFFQYAYQSIFSRCFWQLMGKLVTLCGNLVIKCYKQI